MKAVGLALLLANLLFLAWSQWLAPDERALTVSSVPDGIPQLTLADEVRQNADASASAISGRPEPDTTGASASAESESAGGEVLESAEGAEGQSGSELSGEGLISAGQSGAAPSLPAASASAGAAQRPAELLTGIQRCVSIGPFRDLAEATQGSASLRTAGHDPRTRVAEGDVWAGLWVHLAGLGTRSEAQRAVSVLKQSGIRDAYIMPSAGRTTDISLGIFSEPARAQRRADDVRALGFSPTVSESTRKGTVYWIDVDLSPTDGFIDPASIPGEEGKISRLKVEACPTPEA